VGKVLSQEKLENAHCWEPDDHVPRQPAMIDFAEACDRYRRLLVDQSTFSSMTLEELLDGSVLPTHTAAALRERYIPR